MYLNKKSNWSLEKKTWVCLALEELLKTQDFFKSLFTYLKSLAKIHVYIYKDIF